MPIAFYAISFKHTGGLVALVSCERQDLTIDGAPDRLLDALIGPRLPISMSTAGAPMEIPVGDLACDPVKPPERRELEEALAAPYQFRVGLKADEPVLPKFGDGKEKELFRANQHTVNQVELPAESRELTVKLSSAPTSTPAARLLIEGRPPITGHAAHGKPSELIFPLLSDIDTKAGASFGMVLFVQGAPSEARVVRVPAGAAGGSPSVTTPVRLPWTSP